MKKHKVSKGVEYINCGDTLADLIERLTEAGVKDFSKVTIQMDFVSCQCDHGDDYCYCDSSYDNIRLEWEI